MGIGHDQGSVANGEACRAELKRGRSCSLERTDRNHRTLDPFDRADRVVRARGKARQQSAGSSQQRRIGADRCVSSQRTARSPPTPWFAYRAVTNSDGAARDGS